MFNFKLQKVLDYRENLEKKSKEEFAEKLSYYNKKQEELNILINKKEIIKNKEYIKTLKTSQELMVYQRYLDYLEKSIEEKKIELSQCESEMEKARLELIKSTKDKKIMEILKESAFDEYLDEENKIEQKKLDDIALRGYIDSMKGGGK